MFSCSCLEFVLLRRRFDYYYTLQEIDKGILNAYRELVVLLAWDGEFPAQGRQILVGGEQDV